VIDETLKKANFYSQKRGPDQTRMERVLTKGRWNIVLLHNLLDISGNSAFQPVLTECNAKRIWTLFNGEIYNYRDFADVSSDTNCIAQAFIDHGLDAGRRFDGEFAIVLFDETDESLYIFTDPFLTKPLYIGTSKIDGEIGVATCASALRSIGFSQINLVQPNSAYEVHFYPNRFELNIHNQIWKFDLNQNKNNYQDWADAFLKAVYKRANHGAHRPMVYLSSGYDSGGICLALNMLQIEYDSYTIVSGEETSVLNQRIKINRDASCRKAVLVSGLSLKDKQQIQRDIVDNVEPFQYVHQDSPGEYLNIYEGQKFYYHSEFGGKFPEDLRPIFPWKKFYGDSQRSYLFKEEYILGRHGLEGRYPYLDKFLVQEFLSLSSALKNETYKSPLASVFKACNYPFEAMKKRGFGPMIPAIHEAALAGRPPIISVI
jgi:hypothetical protein